MKKTHRFAVVALPVALAAGTALLFLSRLPAQEPPRESAAASAPGAVKEDPNAVARMGDFVITRAELEERLLRAIRPQDEEYPARRPPVTPKAVLEEMLGERAMSLEGRQRGYLQDEAIHTRIEEMEQQRLAQMVAEDCIRTRMPTHEAEVEAAAKADPKLRPEQARIAVQRQILAEVRKELESKFQLKKLEDNFVQAALVHQRLLLRPATPRGANEYWIKNSQVHDELSEKEQGLVLATYKGGKFTLKDWFRVVCNIAPPRRPSDLNTPAGVGRLLDNALWTPLFVAEAKARGYDKDPKLRSDIRRMEDQSLLYKMIEEKTKGLKEPSADEIKAYFEQNRQRFAKAATLKIDEIWCQDLETARKLKADLDGGADFEALKKDRSLQKEMPAHNVYPAGEGPFWDELDKAEPNQVIGPVHGFYGSGIKWRIVKVLEKKAAQEQEYSEQLGSSLKWILMDEHRQRLLQDYRQELLQKYPYQIFEDRIRDLDPIKIGLSRKDS
jgi:hypothetical protein